MMVLPLEDFNKITGDSYFLHTIPNNAESRPRQGNDSGIDAFPNCLDVPSADCHRNNPCEFRLPDCPEIAAAFWHRQ